MPRSHKAAVALFAGVSFSTLSLMTYPVQASANVTESPASWNGAWFGTTTPAVLSLEFATKSTVDFDSWYGESGQAHIHGNTASFTNSTFHESFKQLSGGKLQMVYQKVNDPKSRLVEIFVRNPIQSMTLSVPKEDTALFTGKTAFAPGTVLELDVANAQDRYPNVNLVCWEATVGSNGQIHSENDISWLKSGSLDIRGYVSEIGDYDIHVPVTSIRTNVVQTTIDQRSVAKDARRYYKPGTPAYSVADYVYKNPVVQLPEWGLPLYLQGIGSYHLTYTSKTSALVYTRLQIGALPGATLQLNPWDEPKLMYYAFTLMGC